MQVETSCGGDANDAPENNRNRKSTDAAHRVARRPFRKPLQLVDGFLEKIRPLCGGRRKLAVIALTCCHRPQLLEASGAVKLANDATLAQPPINHTLTEEEELEGGP